MARSTLESMLKGFEVLELVSRFGNITVVQVAKAKGWERAQASRYLKDLCTAGWVENVGRGRRPRYVLGNRTLNLVPDVRI